MKLLKFEAAKGNFFDRSKVIKALDRANLRVLNQFGRLVRKQAQGSLKYSDRRSPPGSPPAAHRSRSITKTSRSTGKTRKRSVSFLREYLFYSYDDAAKSVVIGPSKLNSTVDSGALPALEYGGSSTVRSRGKGRRVRIRPRPFMRPALDAEMPKLAPLWRNSVR